MRPRFGSWSRSSRRELDPGQDGLLDLLAERSRSGRVVKATTEAAAVDRLAEPEIQAIESGDWRQSNPRTTGGVGNPMSFS